MPVQRKPNPLAVAAILLVHATVATLTWRDIASRSDAQVRGPKNLWRVASALNSGASAVYWIVGRKSRG